MTATAPPSRAAVIRRLIRGIGSSTLTQAIGSLQTIVLVPFFIRAWGDTGYGQWLTLTAAASYLTLVDLGGQSYTANILAMHSARGELELFRRRLAEAVSVFSVLSISALIVVGLGLTAGLWLAVPGLGRPLQRGEAIVLALLACSNLLGVPGGVYGTVYRATGDFVRGAMIGNVIRAVWLVVTAGLLFVAVDQTTYAVAFVMSTITGMSAVIIDTRARMPACRDLRLNLASAYAGARDLRHAVYFWIITIVQTIIQQGVVLLLALLTTPATVALYVTHRTLANISSYVGNLLQAPIAPEISFLWAQDRRTALAEMLVVATRTVVVTTGLVALVVWVVVPLLYPYWTGRRLSFMPLLLGVMLIQAVSTAAWSPTSWSMLSTNHHRWVAICSVAGGVLTLMSAAALVPRWGVSGAAMAALAADVVAGAIGLPLVAARYLEIPASQTYRQIVLSLLALAPVTAAAVGFMLLISGWWAAVLVVLSVAASALALRRFAFAGREINLRF